MEGIRGLGPDIQFQQDMATAQARSREETPGCLPAREVIQLGIGGAAKLGILCRPPNLPLVHNSFVPMDGNCIQSSCCHANDPTLSGEPLKQAAWELRVTGVGTALECLRNFSELEWSVLQGIISGEAKEKLSREQIQQELAKYMESGIFSGNVGDILPQLAADILHQPLLIIEVENHKMKTANWIVPGGIFGGGNQQEGYPIVVIKQLQHFEPLLIAHEAMETARLKYTQWKTSKRVGVSDGEEMTGRSDDEGMSSKDVPRDSQRVGELHHCNCGHKGAIAKHLRSSNHCVQDLREELSFETEMSDEVLITQATLILGGCPAVDCPGGNHGEMPASCLSWWKEAGWNLMQWQGPSSDLNNAVVIERVNQFVKKLTQGHEQQQQDNFGERPIEDPADTFVPATNVSLH